MDQFVISNMMKELDPTRSGTAKSQDGKFYRTLFETLDRLSKQQLIVCPDSPIHDFESIVDTRYEKIRAVFRHLSSGVSFREPEAIVHAQIMRAFNAWHSGNPCQNQVSRDFALTSNLDVWTERYRIELNAKLPEFANELSTARHAMTAELHDVCARWRGDPHFSFKRTFEEELAGHAKKIFEQFFDYSRRFAAVQFGQAPPHRTAGPIRLNLLAPRGSHFFGPLKCALDGKEIIYNP